MENIQQSTIAIMCRKCGQEGAIVWERPGDKPKWSILSISDGFYRRVRGNHSALPSIICDSCGAILKGHASPVSEAPANEEQG